MKKTRNTHTTTTIFPVCIRWGQKDPWGTPSLSSHPNVADVYDCQALCQAEAACKYFVYDISVAKCWLKTIDYTDQLVSGGDWVSGPKYCDSCILPDTNCPGFDVAGTITAVANPSDCQQLCLASADCMFYTYSHAWRQCYLKSQGLGCQEWSIGVSGYKKCNGMYPSLTIVSG